MIFFSLSLFAVRVLWCFFFIFIFLCFIYFKFRLFGSRSRTLFFIQLLRHATFLHICLPQIHWTCRWCAYNSFAQNFRIKAIINYLLFALDFTAIMKMTFFFSLCLFQLLFAMLEDKVYLPDRIICVYDVVPLFFSQSFS